jgi:molecular chaperone DnaK
VTYWLGIDLGTTYTAAALCRPVKGELQTHVVPLGGRTPAVPSVLFLPGDGSLVVGEAAEHQALTEPDRVVREFKRRIGDEIPLLVGGVPWQAHELAAVLARWVFQWVNQVEGELPEGVALTCPASWGPYKISVFEQALRTTRIGEATRLGSVQLLSEPQAAAIGYASQEQVEVGARLAVYDLGGGTFDAAVVRKDSPTAFTLLGRPEGIDRLGGVTFDEMLFEHVCAAAGVPLSRIDPNNPYIIPEVARLRRECTAAKEALSVDTEANVPVALGGVRQQVRVTRAEFEEMIRPELDRTIEALHRALDSAAVDGTQLDAILLVGGSSRIPLVSQLISAEFGRAPAIDADPKITVAVGAARFLAPVPQPAEDFAAPATMSSAAFGAPATVSSAAVSSAALMASAAASSGNSVSSEDTVATNFQLPAVPPARPRVSTALSSDAGSTAGPARRYSPKVLIGAGALVLVLAAGVATALGAPKLTDQTHQAAAAPVATRSAVSAPPSSAPAAPASTKPHSTTSSASGTNKSSGKTITSLAAMPEPVKNAAPTPTAKSTPKPTPSASTAKPTPTRTRTHTSPASGSSSTTTSPTTDTPTDTPPTSPSTTDSSSSSSSASTLNHRGSRSAGRGVR